MKKFNKAVGNLGERIAVDYLIKKKYMILETNYSNNIGEIDIIALDEDYIVFVEVKARSDRRYGAPNEAVDDRKRKKIYRISSKYLAEKGWLDVNVRYDIIEIVFDEKYINHIENAFIVSEF